MITAEEARRLAGPTLEEKVEAIADGIKKAAEEKKRRYVPPASQDPDLWITGGYERSQEWLEAKKRLESLGYKVTFFYEERQFVDMYTVIEW